MGHGTIYPKESLIMRVEGGTASYGSQHYELGTCLGGNPIIKSETTGKYFSLSWAELVDMAIEAGIDEEDR